MKIVTNLLEVGGNQLFSFGNGSANRCGLSLFEFGGEFTNHCEVFTAVVVDVMLE